MAKLIYQHDIDELRFLVKKLEPFPSNPLSSFEMPEETPAYRFMLSSCAKKRASKFLSFACFQFPDTTEGRSQAMQFKLAFDVTLWSENAEWPETDFIE